jgi:hypothetical protein
MQKKIILLLLVSFTSLFPQSAGNTGLAFLKYGFGARNIAMGDAGTSLSTDVTSLFYNPAGLAINPASEIMIMHNAWIQDIKSEILGARTVVWGIPIAFGFNVTTIPGIEVRTIASDNPLSTFSANDFFGSISAAYKIMDYLSVGVTYKYLYEAIYVDEANGWGVDLGATYISPIQGLNVSAAVKNMGSMNALRNVSTKLPTEFRIGPSYSFSPAEKFDVTGAAEFQKYTPDNDSHVNFGAEVLYDKLVALRFGYQTGYATKSISAGFGLMWGNLSFDYAFAPFNSDSDLGNGNIVSLQFKF